MLVMAQVVRGSSISIIGGARIIGAHASTIKTLLSSSSGGSTEWKRELRAAGFKLKEVLPPALEAAARVHARSGTAMS